MIDIEPSIAESAILELGLLKAHSGPSENEMRLFLWARIASCWPVFQPASLYCVVRSKSADEIGAAALACTVPMLVRRLTCWPSNPSIN